MAENEIAEVKALKWLTIQFPEIEDPKDDTDRLQNCINLYCTNAINKINSQQADIEFGKTINHLQMEELQEEQAEIERLKAYNENLLTANTALSNELLEAKAETVKEITENINKDFFVGRLLCL